MDHEPQWIWQQADWPTFHWDGRRLSPALRRCALAQGRLLGLLQGTNEAFNAESELDALLQNIVTSSAIEGERLNVGTVRSSLARRLGLPGQQTVTPRSEGLAQLMVEAISAFDGPLTLKRLLYWHELLFAHHGDAFFSLRIGELRGEEPMQVVSGRIDRPVIHFEAPPRHGLDHQLKAFLDWFNASLAGTTLDPLLRAGIAHFWFVTLHPFEDGNGRLTRALTDMALAQADGQSIRFYAMSASILAHREAYYRVLEQSQKGGLDISDWLEWFLQIFAETLQQATARIERVMAKARFWQRHRQHGLSKEEIRVLNRMLDGDLLADRPGSGFSDSINARQYQAVAKVSKATATRHLTDLLEKGCLEKQPGGGRSTRYKIRWN